MRTYFYATAANALVMEPWRQVSVGDGADYYTGMPVRITSS